MLQTVAAEMGNTQQSGIYDCAIARTAYSNWLYDSFGQHVQSSMLLETWTEKGSLGRKLLKRLDKTNMGRGITNHTRQHHRPCGEHFFTSCSHSCGTRNLNSLRPRQNGRHFTDDIFNCIFLNENAWKPIKISLKFVPKGPINNIPALVQIMAWHRPGDIYASLGLNELKCVGHWGSRKWKWRYVGLRNHYVR